MGRIKSTLPSSRELLLESEARKYEERESEQSLLESAARLGVTGANWIMSEGYGLRLDDSSFDKGSQESLDIMKTVPTEYWGEFDGAKSKYDMQSRANQINNMYEAQQNLSANLGTFGTFAAIGAISIADPLNLVGGFGMYKATKAFKTFETLSNVKKATVFGTEAAIENIASEYEIQSHGLGEYEDNLVIAGAAGFAMVGGLSHLGLHLDTQSLKLQEQKIAEYVESDVSLKTSPQEAMAKIDEIENISKITPIKNKVTTVLDWITGGKSTLVASPSRIMTNKGGVQSIEANKLETPLYRLQDEEGKIVDISAENAMDSYYRQKENLMNVTYKNSQEFNARNKELVEQGQKPLTATEFELEVMRQYRKFEAVYKNVKAEIKADMLTKEKVDELYGQAQSTIEGHEKPDRVFTEDEQVKIEDEYRALENEFLIKETESHPVIQFDADTPTLKAVQNKLDYYKKVHEDMLDANMPNARTYDSTFYSHIEYNEAAIIKNPEIGRKKIEEAIRQSNEYKSQIESLKKEIAELKDTEPNNNEINSIQREVNDLEDSIIDLETSNYNISELLSRSEGLPSDILLEKALSEQSNLNLGSVKRFQKEMAKLFDEILINPLDFRLGLKPRYKNRFQGLYQTILSKFGDRSDAIINGDISLKEISDGLYSIADSADTAMMKSADKVIENLKNIEPKFKSEKDAMSFYFKKYWGKDIKIIDVPKRGGYNDYYVALGEDNRRIFLSNKGDTWEAEVMQLKKGSGEGEKIYNAIFDFINSQKGKYITSEALTSANQIKIPINAIAWFRKNPESNIFSVDQKKIYVSLLRNIDTELRVNDFDLRSNYTIEQLAYISKETGLDMGIGIRSLSLLQSIFRNNKLDEGSYKKIFKKEELVDSRLEDFFKYTNTIDIDGNKVKITELEKFIEETNLKKEQAIESRNKRLEKYESDMATKTKELINLGRRPRLQARATVHNMERRSEVSLRDELDEYSVSDVDFEKAPNVLRGRKLTVDQNILQDAGFLLDPLDAMARYDYKIRGKIATQKATGFQKLSDYRNYLATVKELSNDDVEMLVDMFRSVQGSKQLSQDPDSVRNQLVRGATNFNYITMGGQFGAYGVSELAAGVMRSGWTYVSELVPSLKTMVKMYRNMELDELEEANVFLSDSTDIMARLNMSRQGDSYTPDELFATEPKTVGQKVSSGLSNMSRGFYKWSGLEGITTITKTAIPNSLSQRIFKEYVKNPNVVAADLQRFGFSTDFLRKVMEQPIDVNSNGTITNFNFDKWDIEVAAKYRRFISRAVRETIVSVDGTRLPMWMTNQSTAAMFLLAKQFMSFSAVAHERLLLAGINERAAMSMVAMLTSASILGVFQLASQEAAIAMGTLKEEDKRFDMETEIGRKRFFEYIGTRQSFSGNFGQLYEFVADVTDPSRAIAASTQFAGGVTASRVLQTRRALSSALDGEFGSKNQTSVIKGLIPYNNIIGMDYAIKHGARTMFEGGYHK